MGRTEETTGLLWALLIMAACSQPPTPPATDGAPEPSETTLAMMEEPACPNVMSEAALQSRRKMQRNSEAKGAEPALNILGVEGPESFTWNEARVDAVTLRQYLDIVTTLVPQPLVIVRPGAAADEASLARARELLYLGLGCRPDF